MSLWQLILIFSGSFAMGLSGALMPGPLFMVTVSESLHRGAKAGPLIILGHAILELSLIIVISLGLGSIIELSMVKGIIGLVGGLFLLWMSYGMIREASRADFKLNYKDSQAVRRIHPTVAGITVSASNPYWSLWWATVGAGSLVLAEEKGLAGIGAFYLGHILADLSWYSALSVAVAKGKRLISTELYRGVIVICGLFLCFLAIYFMYSGYTFFMG